MYTELCWNHTAAARGLHFGPSRRGTDGDGGLVAGLREAWMAATTCAPSPTAATTRFSAAPDRAHFAYTFDQLADVIDRFTEVVGLRHIR